MLQKKESKNSIKVGVLVPQSPAYPRASINFVNGVKLYFTLFENQFSRGSVELNIVDIGDATSNKVKEKAQELLMQFQPDCILGYMNASTGIELANNVNNFDVPVVISNLGENAVDSSEIPENLYFNTFQFWQSYYQLGRYLSGKWDNEWLLISSLHDTGYDPLRAFRLGLQYNNATISQEIYLNANTSAELIHEYRSHLKYSKEAIPAVFFPPALLNPILNELSSDYETIITTPFYNETNNAIKYWAFPENTLRPDLQYFTKGVAEYLDMEADLFHLLGYRAGAMLYEAAKSMEQGGQDKNNILNSWSQFEFQTGENKCCIDPVTRDLSGNTTIFKGNSINRNYEVVNKILANKIDETVNVEITKDKAAFTNPYMFY